MRANGIVCTALCALVLGCSGTTTDEGGGSGSAPDASATGSTSGDPTGAATSLCASDLACPSGKSCIGGSCQDDPCLAASPVCTTADGSEGVGRGVCVPDGSGDVADPCDGAACAADETCFGGSCVAGCYPTSTAACSGIVCGTDEHCDPATERCVETDPDGAGLDCPEGTVGHCECAPPMTMPDTPSPSDTTTDCPGGCSAGQRCVSGECVEDLCAGVTCTGTSACVNGECVDTCDCPGGGCPEGSRCVFGECVCEDTCPDEDVAVCGQPDGCGGTCKGMCPDGQRCRRDGEEDGPGDLWFCECIPNCDEEAPCGGPDGCGGVCDSGKCDDPGTYCNDAICVCLPDCPRDAPCGGPDGCGGSCERGACPAGEFCDDGVCQCEPDCDTAACGGPDGCGGTCRRGTCPGGEFCNDGVCQCAPDCDGAVCGGPDGCGGACDEGSCPTGERCRRGACECAPRCTTCGGPDGCGGTCREGSCPGGEFCDDGVCQPTPPDTCDPPCGCGEACSSGVCIPLCGSGETLCGCNTCCGPGESCTAGVCTGGPA